jgi:hypothetical protein
LKINFSGRETCPLSNARTVTNFDKYEKELHNTNINAIKNINVNEMSIQEKFDAINYFFEKEEVYNKLSKFGLKITNV